MSVARLLFPRPTQQRIAVERVRVDVRCPACGSDDVRRYPVADSIGPRIVTNCQDCFHQLSLEIPTEDDHWPPWRSATHGWPATRAG
jgi:hypothetical protein